MRRQIILRSVLLLTAVVGLGGFLVSDVSAATCSSSSTRQNDSLYDACRWSGVRGAMWISSSSSTTSVSAKVVVDNWSSGDGKVTAYLHGAIIGGSSATATHIKLLKGTSAIYGRANGAAYAPLENVPSSMNRHGNTRSSTIKSTVKTIKVNIVKLMELETRSSVNSDGYWVYKVPIQAFRCYDGRSLGSDGCYSSTSTLTVEVAPPEAYSGMSRAAGATGSWNDIADNKKVQTGWKDSGTNNKVTYYIQNCDPVDGCTASIRHLLRRDAGNGSTTYNITRTSNYESISAGDVVTQTTENFTGDGVNTNSNGQKYRTVKVTNFIKKMYPGQVVCETLTFKAKGSTNAATTACVSALGNAQPGDPDDPDTPEDPNTDSGDTSFINIKVRNADVDNYKKYQRSVYAKPGDHLTFRATYNPNLQYTYKLKPEQMRINGGTVYDRNTTLTSGFLGKNSSAKKSMFNYYKGSSLKEWNNGFSVQLSAKNNFNSADQTWNYGGSSRSGNKTKMQQTNQAGRSSGMVEATDAGKNIQEKAVTNLNGSTQTTPSQVIFTKNGDKNLGNVKTDNKSKIASAKVPYNYINTTEITNDNNKEVMYAGEVFKVNYNYNINPKKNNLTMNSGDRNYATSVGNPKWRLKVSINGGAWVETSEVSTRTSDFDVPLNKMYDGKVGENAVKLSSDINVPDVPAGTKICVKSVIFPQASGADSNLNGDGNGLWAESSEKCFTVAKKPSLQVWGGNMYTGGKITTSVSEKGLLANTNYPPYQIEGNTGKKYVFGSWAELGVIANASVTKFASGASTGYPLGSQVTNFCERVPLTIANRPCSSNVTGSIGTSAALNNAASDKESIINKLMVEDVYKYSMNDLTLNESVTAGHGEVKVVYARGNVTINQDITYVGSYKGLSDVPKVVVYGKNIVIGCGVSKIDALLIAEEKIVTCDNFEGDLSNVEQKAESHINERVNSNQLKVNGAVLANKLIANRTYGAAPGADSVTSAEIINFDPTLYLWGTAGDSSGRSSTQLEVTYLHELAPRR